MDFRLPCQSPQGLIHSKVPVLDEAMSLEGGDGYHSLASLGINGRIR